MKDPSLLAELRQYQYIAREWAEAQQEFIHVSTRFNKLTLERNDCIGRLEAADVRARVQTAEELAPMPPPSHLDFTTPRLYKLEDHLGNNGLSLRTNPFAPLSSS